MASRMSDAVRENGARAQDMIHRMKERAPDSNRVLRVGGAAAGVMALLTAAAVATGGVVITLFVASPLLVALSPVLVPLAVVGTLVVGALVMAVAALCAAAWVYKYVKGRHPVGSKQVDAAKCRIVDTASHMTEKARAVGSNVTGYLQNKAREAAPGA